jgi:MFS family permease
MARPTTVTPPDAPRPPAATGGSLAVTTWGLFVGLAVMIVGVGLFATLIGVRAEIEAFGTLAIGAIGGAYYAGFVVGSRIALRVVGTVGHIRVYAALGSLLAAVVLAAGLVVDPVAWLLLRFLGGVFIAGVYVVAESWLNQIATNANRARLLSVYGVVTVMPYGVGQLLLGAVDPLEVGAFAIAAVAIAVAVSPVTLSAVANPPPVSVPTRIGLVELLRIAPTGIVTSFVSGIAMGAVTAFAPVYATRAGMTPAAVGVFTAMPALGSLLLQVPVASLSDRVDRRLVGAVAAAGAAGSTALLLVDGPDGVVGHLAMVCLGGTMFPLYSIAGAYTNDRLPRERLTAAASQLVVLFGVGAFIGPFAMAAVLGGVGLDGYPLAATVVLAFISVFLAVRIVQHPAAERVHPEQLVPLDELATKVPATAVAMGRRIRPRRRA